MSTGSCEDSVSAVLDTLYAARRSVRYLLAVALRRRGQADAGAA